MLCTWGQARGIARRVAGGISRHVPKDTPSGARRRGVRYTDLTGPFLPLAETQAPVQHICPSATRQRTPTVLIVEDDPTVTRVMTIVLQREGFTVVAADNGLRGITEFWGHAGDLALMLVDIEMPIMTGPQFVASIPTLDPRVPVVFTSTHSEEAIAELARDGFPLLYKPFTPDSLVESVRKALTAQAAERRPRFGSA